MQPYIQSLQAVWNNFVRHVPLLMNLISRDLKKKYRRSVLGYVWCVLNPLLVIHMRRTMKMSRFIIRLIKDCLQHAMQVSNMHRVSIICLDKLTYGRCWKKRIVQLLSILPVQARAWLHFT